jgi:hypothetical protein
MGFWRTISEEDLVKAMNTGIAAENEIFIEIDKAFDLPDDTRPSQIGKDFQKKLDTDIGTTYQRSSPNKTRVRT